MKIKKIIAALGALVVLASPPPAAAASAQDFVQEKYGLKNGLMDAKRDIFIKLLMHITAPEDERNLIGTCEEIYNYTKHHSFLLSHLIKELAGKLECSETGHQGAQKRTTRVISWAALDATLLEIENANNQTATNKTGRRQKFLHVLWLGQSLPLPQLKDLRCESLGIWNLYLKLLSGTSNPFHPLCRMKTAAAKNLDAPYLARHLQDRGAIEMIGEHARRMTAFTRDTLLRHYPPRSQLLLDCSYTATTDKKSWLAVHPLYAKPIERVLKELVSRNRKNVLWDALNSPVLSELPYREALGPNVILWMESDIGTLILISDKLEEEQQKTIKKIEANAGLRGATRAIHEYDMTYRKRHEIAGEDDVIEQIAETASVAAGADEFLGYFADTENADRYSVGTRGARIASQDKKFFRVK
ncbi:hypothetical protein AGMMS49949_01360 [Alphaproteobacteria bacterium]|nr:hypothetical protein AGMMS49949_01360 [Alphaproteobacteria bacterium]GHS95682.1 hypothetical protein AGMMS50296_0570 [Alphaproteobacteria bacterium]